MNMTTKKITTLGMLCALAVIVNLLIHFPLIPSVEFLSYDAKDVIIVIGGFIYGPGSAFIMSVITSLLEIMYRGGNLLDVLMNVISTCTFTCVAAWIYKRDHTREGAFIGLGAGIVCCVLSMLLWNYIVTPIYFGMPREAVVSILIPGILPFNLLKCGLNTGLTLFLYKPIVGVFRRTSLVEHSSGGDHAITKGTVLIGLFICASVICFILGFQG
ncbi:MAG: ECF transporter S component, partial [Merdibacter sp.]